MQAVNLPQGFLDNVFAAIDSLDADLFVTYLTEDCIFRFGSAPGVKGRAAINAAVSTFFGSIAGCSHSVSKVWHDDDNLACEGEVCYRRLDDAEIILPFVDVFDIQDGLISAYKIYIDIHPLYAT
jgi:limonene-1,2-epoxide hydrolase